MRRRSLLLAATGHVPRLRGAPLEEWRRSKPDFAVYVPEKQEDFDAENQHFLVVPLPSGTFLAMWTRASVEGASNQHIVCSRSTDLARTWSAPKTIDGPAPGDARETGLASWGFPIVAPNTGRVWCFFNKNIGVTDFRAQDTGVLRAVWSDDEGRTWSREHRDFPIGRNDFSHPDPNFPQCWIVYQAPFVDRDGSVIAGLTHWANKTVAPVLEPEKRTPSEILFLHFENILEERDPRKLVVTTIPKGKGIRLFAPPHPKYSVIQEPTIQQLSGGRYICVTRTVTGHIYFSLSKDRGLTWSEPDVLRYRPGGDPLLHPRSPGPLYKLTGGRFLIIFHNNDGGPGGPLDYKVNRRPTWLAVGREIPGHPTHPLQFAKPRILVDNDAVPIGPRGLTEIGTYTSFFEHKGKRHFWYPDRKHFLLGKLITDAALT